TGSFGSWGLPWNDFMYFSVLISFAALFTEVPHDITTRSGEDVEMACSFRGAGSPSYSLEIQWWYIKGRRDWQEQPAQITNDIVPLEETSKDATKISVVKVAGGNISHKLRLSSVKPSDEGTYECRVIDFSGTVAQHHRVRAHLQVEPESKLQEKYYMLITPTYHHHFLFYAVYHLNHTLIWLVFVLSAAVWDLFY
uniref:Ig-like domain-containing protein n=1 Tax=Mola mola TaxID=94237 RepID=A0A3Q3WBN6_MOLML